MMLYLTTIIAVHEIWYILMTRRSYVFMSRLNFKAFKCINFKYLGLTESARLNLIHLISLFAFSKV